MTASLDSVRAILTDWQNKSQQLELKIWEYGISIMQRGVVVRCDQESFVIADLSTKLHITFAAVKRVLLAQSADESTVQSSLVELELSGGLSATFYEAAANPTFGPGL